MLAQQSGSIVNLASVEGLEGGESMSAYNASKGGVVLLTQNMALDYGALRHPRERDLPRLHRDADDDASRGPELRADHASASRSRTRSAGSASPKRSRTCALFLASDDASFVSGGSLTVDGGFHAGKRFGISAQMMEAAQAAGGANSAAGGSSSAA